MSSDVDRRVIWKNQIDNFKLYEISEYPKTDFKRQVCYSGSLVHEYLVSSHWDQLVVQHWIHLLRK